jgi:T-complex protein 1 subunit theta
MARSLTGGSFGVQGMLKEGTKHMAGLEEATFKNIEAAKQLSSCVRTSLGPNGMNKMVINHLDKLFITSDSATIVQELEVQHPAAKLLVMASKMQESEVGDGTNFVVVLAGELLVLAEELLKNGLHISEVIGGYNASCVKALEELNKLECYSAPVDVFGDETKLAGCIRSAIASKQWGNEELFAAKIAQACVLAMPENVRNFNIDNIRVAKIVGNSVGGTTVVKGLCLTRNVIGQITDVKDAKIVVYGIPLDSSATETKGTVLLKSAEELKAYNNSEEEALERTIKAIAGTGANVVVCGQSIGELALHFVEKYRMMVLKVPSKFELRRLCRTTGATNLVRLEPPAPEELGQCKHVHVKEIGSTMCTIFDHETNDSKMATIVVRGSSMNIMDDVERAIDDGVNVVKSMTRDARFVPGAGATELRLADALQQHAEAQPGLDQYAINKFGLALEVVPRTLAENAGLDATNIVAEMYAAHKAGNGAVGVNISEGTAADNGVFDLLATKAEAIKLATEAAVTVLRVDQIIMAKPAGGPKAPEQAAPYG